MVIKFKPLDDRILVRRVESENKTASGIIIPDTAKEKPQEGEVLAVGEGRLMDNGTRVKPSLKIGDKILFAKWSGTEVKIGSEELLIMKEVDVLGTLS